jgi:outer membrane cobalamin receptor
MHKKLFSPAALVALIAPAFAQSVPETVVVSATRTTQPLEVTGESVSLMTGEEIDSQQIDIVAARSRSCPALPSCATGDPARPPTC